MVTSVQCHPRQTSGVSCGSHRADSCALCPFDSQGNDYGAGWCNGECQWRALTGVVKAPAPEGVCVPCCTFGWKKFDSSHDSCMDQDVWLHTVSGIRDSLHGTFFGSRWTPGKIMGQSRHILGNFLGHILALIGSSTNQRKIMWQSIHILGIISFWDTPRQIFALSLTNDIVCNA